MNREIKFRGVKANGSGLVYGSLFNSASGLTIIENGGEDMSYFHFVLPETVGQFIGIKDKNGKDIYEGDILSLKLSNFTDTIIVKIEYSQKNENFGHGEFGKSEFIGFKHIGYYGSISDYEVAGNIYENKTQ